MIFLARFQIGFWVAILPFSLADDAERDSEIEDLISSLNSEKFSEREAATQALWTRGKVGLSALNEARHSPDPEVSIRARNLLEKLEMEITPDTPEEVIRIIDSYEDSLPRERGQMLRELRDLGAYFQALKLYASEDLEGRSRLAGSIKGFAVAGARQEIIKGNYEEAESLLRISVDSAADRMALACFYEGRGVIDEQLTVLDVPNGATADEWRLALLQAQGNIDSAADLAAELGDRAVLAMLRILQGDPRLWLKENGFGTRGMEATDDYVRLATARWAQKGSLMKKDVMALKASLSEGAEKDRAMAVRTAAALGFLKEVEALTAESDPVLLTAFFISQERIDEAFDLLGLNEERDYQKWFAERLGALSESENAEDPEMAMAEDSSREIQIIQLASFLESRGLHAELKGAAVDSFLEFHDHHPEFFVGLLKSLFQAQSGAPEFALSLSSVWAGSDEDRWSEVWDAALGDNKDVIRWLDWMAETRPAIGHEERLRGALALFQITKDPQGLRDEWLDLAWEQALDDKENGQDLISKIGNLAMVQQDVENVLRAYDNLETKEDWRWIDRFFSAAGRWEDALEILTATETNGQSLSPEMHAYLAVHFRKSGRDKDAEIHDRLAADLALGQTSSSLAIGATYSYGGELDKASRWFWQALVRSDPSAIETKSALEAYLDSAMEQGEYSVAAACGEALAHIYATRRYSRVPVPEVLKVRLNADLARAAALIDEDRSAAISLLDKAHSTFPNDGVLADVFFPKVREIGLTKELEAWFEKSWGNIAAMIAAFPDSDNTRNTAAWLASRAGMRVEEGEKLLRRALELNPDQAAYLDTMAEVLLAQGRTQEALKWSTKSIYRAPIDPMIRKQNQRFRKAAQNE